MTSDVLRGVSVTSNMFSCCVCISTYDSVPSQYNIKEGIARRDVFENALEYEMQIIYTLKADFD